MIPLIATETRLVQVSKKKQWIWLCWCRIIVKAITFLLWHKCVSWIILALTLPALLLNRLWCLLKSSQYKAFTPFQARNNWVSQCVRGLCSWADPANTLPCPASSPASPPPATWPASTAASFVCSASASCRSHWVSGLIRVTRTAVWITRRLRSCMASTKKLFFVHTKSLLGLLGGEHWVWPIVQFWFAYSFCLLERW